MTNTTPGTPDSLDIAKAQARRLATALKGKTAISHGQALELVAKMHGSESWGHLRAALSTENKGSITIPTKAKGTVLFKGSYTLEIISIINFWKRQSTGIDLNDEEMDDIKSILKSLHDECVYLEAEAYFSEITVESLVEAEASARNRYLLPYKGKLSAKEIIAYLPEDPYKASFDDRTSVAIEEACCSLDEYYRQRQEFDIGHELVSGIVNGGHSVVVGKDISRIASALGDCFNFTNQGPVHPEILAGKLRVACPQSGFSMGGSAVSWLVRKSSKRSTFLRSRSDKKIPLVVRASDFDTQLDALSQFLIRARAMDIHIFFWEDRDLVPTETWSTLVGMTKSVVDYRNMEKSVVFK